MMSQLGHQATDEFDCPLLELTYKIFLRRSSSILKAVSVVHKCSSSCKFVSKWVEAFALPDKSADSVARGIYAAYCRHDAPNDIITDQGREFVNKVTIAVNYVQKIIMKLFLI